MNTPSLPLFGSATEVALRFSQADFDLFARLSGDDNPIHVDPVFSAGTRFGRTVAHGMLLFAASHAAINRWIGGPLTLHQQQFMFPAPTFADEDLNLHLAVHTADQDVHRQVEVTIRGALGETCRASALVGFDELSDEEDPSPASDTEAEQYKGMWVGMRAQRTRRLSVDEVAAFIELVGDPHPHYHGQHPVVPPPLLSGMISDLLGVSLPGAGANWLKQAYRFHRQVPVGDEIQALVEITRLRPTKHLVNLRTVCQTEAGVAVTGDALVLAKDVAMRND